MKDEILSIFDRLISRYEHSGLVGLSIDLKQARLQAGKILGNSGERIEKFLFVEDGSVDTDELAEILESRNPEIQLVVYRQGGERPELVEVKK